MNTLHEYYGSKKEYHGYTSQAAKDIIETHIALGNTVMDISLGEEVSSWMVDTRDGNRVVCILNYSA